MAKVPVYFIYYYDLKKFFHHITSDSGAWKRYQAMKKELGKASHQLISVKEFAEYMDIPKEDVLERL